MYKRIMVPLDGSELAQSALSHAVELCRGLEATLLLVYVRDPRAGSVEAARRYLDFVRNQQAASGVEIEILVREGPVASVLIDVSEKERVDLIAMATHGRSGLQRVVYGSVAEQLLRSSTKPILLVRVAGAPVDDV
ncbi:MAG TPA: universal stress protein [Roseiflexaceae bacterium]|nr:universal stress protein [Roseiflexaceae bacterium]